MYGFGQGLGYDPQPDCVTGQLIDCDSFSNILNSTCWGLCTYTPLPTLPTNAKGATAPPIVPGTVSTLPPGSQDNPDQTVQQQITTQTQTNQAANLTAVQQQAGCAQVQTLSTMLGICDSTLYMGAGLLVIGLFFYVMGGRR